MGGGTMSPEKQQMAIAKACGIVTSDQWGPLYKTAFGLVRDCPDYLNDLNAMHEAEKTLKDNCKEGDYWFFLRDILGFPEAEGDWDRHYFFSAIHATAAQRAEAFLKTLNLWDNNN
jgi:hypothetical protein